MTIETMMGWTISEPKELKKYIIDRAEYLKIIENDSGYSKLRLLRKIEKLNDIIPIDFHQLAGMDELDFTNEIKKIMGEEI